MTPYVIARQLWQRMVNCIRQGAVFEGKQTVSLDLNARRIRLHATACPRRPAFLTTTLPENVLCVWGHLRVENKSCKTVCIGISARITGNAGINTEIASPISASLSTGIGYMSSTFL